MGELTQNGAAEPGEVDATERLVRLVADVDEMLRTIDGPLPDQLRVAMGLEHIVTYLRAAIRQQGRVGEWLYDPDRRVATARRFPLDQDAALCEAHFYFICWDAIRKTIESLRQNAYGLVTPREVLRRHGAQLERYVRARNHLEHFDERLPGRSRSDWQGDANRLTGTVAGIRREGFFAFQREEWDVTETGLGQLVVAVSELIDGVHREVLARYEGYAERGESEIWGRPEAG